MVRAIPLKLPKKRIKVKKLPPPNTINELEARLADSDTKQKQALELLDAIEGMMLPSWRMTGLRIALLVADHHGISYQELIGPNRQQDFVIARHHAMWEIRKHTKLSLPQIGKILGNRDHTTILHGIRRHEMRLAGKIA